MMFVSISHQCNDVCECSSIHQCNDVCECSSIHQCNVCECSDMTKEG